MPEHSQCTRARRVFIFSAALLIASLAFLWCPPAPAAPQTSLALPQNAPPAAVAPVATANPAPGISADGHPVNTVIDTVSVDVIIYGTTTAGLGTLRGLQMASFAYPERFTIAVISAGPHIESPLAQGLAVEDVYGSDSVSGFYAEFRRGVLNEYAVRGIRALSPDNRLLAEPHVADKILRWFLDRNGQGRPNLTWVRGRLVEASDTSDRYALVDCGGRLVRVLTDFFVDASPEGDLARMLGASYMIGKADDVYNDVAGLPAPRPSSDSGYVTAPQALSVLLTLKDYGTPAPRVADLDHPAYDPASYAPGFSISGSVRNDFKHSWSLSYRLPHNTYELNEGWTDYTNAVTAWEWTMFPENRAVIRGAIQTWTLNKFRYLQENGYGHLGLASIPKRPYVREGVRILGRTLFTDRQIIEGASRHSIAFGRYALYDRHDAVKGSEQDDTTAAVHVPMECLQAQGHPWLLVSTAVSTTSRAYSSAVRMESVRANMGGASGVMVAIANAQGVAPADVSYEDVSAELLRQGYRLR